MPEKFPVVAIIPSLNPDDKLPLVVKGLFECGFSDVILVDDGSRDDCKIIFDQLEKLDGCKVLRHECNKGKGRALKTAFSYYCDNYDLSYYCGVVTADADGQHLPKDILKTAQSLFTKDGAVKNLVALGTRDFNEEQVPFKSRNGNKITTFVFKLLYGKHINDTQTGLRAISNDFVQKCITIEGERFEYEINMLIQMVRSKVAFEEVIIETVYFDSNRETHFHPVRDSFKIYKVMLGTFFKFASSGLISVLLDQGLFNILQKLVFSVFSASFSIFISTAIARIISSLVNYSLNRKVVFKSDEAGHKSLVKYYILCALQLLTSAFLVTVLHTVTTLDAAIWKILVDTVLFFVSYHIQRNWVFKKVKK